MKSNTAMTIPNAAEESFDFGGFGVNGLKKEEKPGCRRQPGCRKGKDSMRRGLAIDRTGFPVPVFRSVKVPFRFMSLFLAWKDDPWMTPKLSIGNIGF
jgi:hypothetical protein